MKIEGPNKTGGTKGVSRTGNKGGDGSFGALVGGADETGASAQAGRPSAVGALDALLTAQSMEDAASQEAARKARQRGRDILDLLDQLRLGLLTGDMAAGTIRTLTDTLAQHRQQVTDPDLAEVLDEIDLRAQVELAKLEG